MSAAEVTVGRARPLSGGLWTLFSWLRRDERSSSESLSSVGSDRTAASFAFLAPPQCARRAPLVVPPPGPPTDSYKKRVRDRNLRRHHDRDVTLLRKYGLHGFDAFSLPSARRAGAERDRRAASELLQRRAHVPGKRRAPPPPATLPRPRGRKRPAPQPPVPSLTATKKPDEDIDHLLNDSDTLPMSSRRAPDEQPTKRDVTMDHRSEKYSKKEKHQESKEVKPRQDRSFLKQIFDSRKRHSAIETSSVKLLPSISELDKQAHEIIEKYKLKELEQNTQRTRLDDETPGSSKQVEAWICTRCLRKYNATVITCLYCLPLENALLNNSCKISKVSNHGTQTNGSARTGHEDKEKLKEILKEMKDSLPKNPSAGPSKIKNNNLSESKRDSPKVVEAATLRIGSSVSTESKCVSATEPSSPNHKAKLDQQPRPSDNTKIEILATIENVLVTQPKVLVHTKDNIVTVDINKPSKKEELPKPKPQNSIVSKKVDKSSLTKTEIASKLLNAESTSISCNVNPNVNTPLKVSSLFNPIYVPKTSTSSVPVASSMKENVETFKTQKVAAVPTTVTNITNELAMVSTSTPKPINSNQPIYPLKLEPKKEVKQQSENIVIVKRTVETKPVTTSPSTSQSTKKEDNVIEQLDQHSRRRNLINQLEQSIAKGDEQAAAEAATKLAQLRLSCSVLSFSSQIVAGASTSSETSSQKDNDSKSKIASPSDTGTGKAAPVLTTTLIDTAKITTETNKDHLDANDKTTAEKKEINSLIKLPTVATEPKKETVFIRRSQKKDAAVQSPSRCAPLTAKETVEKKTSSEDVPILVWVEDKEKTRGPVQMHVKRDSRLGELRRQAETTLGLAVRMQRWIVGRALCANDNATLVSLAGPDLSAPFYLCLVESETKEPPITAVKWNEEAGNVYNDLVKLEQQAYVSNAEAFECGVCMEDCPPGKGVVLRECIHSFCNECLSDVVKHSEEPVVACPATSCRGVLQEREIKGLVTVEEYEKWLARGLALAESGTRNAFHCRTRDCSGWAPCDPGVRRFPCPVCNRTNCVPCQAIHEGESCEQHRVKLEATIANNATNQMDEGTRALLDSLIARGEALECPECSAIITKKWGCDWIKCSACKTEICWVTRGRRWGPAGRGDRSGGCRCGTDGKKCHPSCGYCH